MAGGVFAGFRSLVNTLDAVFSTMKLNGPSSTSLQMRMPSANYLAIVDQTYPGATSAVMAVDAGTLIMRGGLSSYQGGTLWSVPKGSATAANPGVSDDGTTGYVAGSRWVNTSTGQFFTCYDATTGAAVWVAMDTADHPGYLSGNSYILAPQTATAAIVPAVDIAHFSPFFVKSRVTVNQMGMRVTTAGTGSAVKYAIYANNTATMRPTGAPLTFNNAGSATTTLNTNIRQTVLNAIPAQAVLVPGVMYWAASKHTGTTLPFATMVGSSSTTNAILLGLSILSSTVQYIGVTALQDYGTDWPSASGLSFSLANGSSSIPLLEMVVA